MTPIEQAHQAAGELRETQVREGEERGELYFHFAGWDGFSGSCHSFPGKTAREGTDDVTMSLSIDGLGAEDVERVLRVLRLGKKADRALSETVAYAAQNEG
jgi:hypothetical protein